MPSQLHEVLLELFRNRPELAPELLRMALDVELPRYTEAKIESADLTDVQPAEYRADLVVLLLDGTPVLGIVVEVQLARDAAKRFAWPVYGAGLRSRIRCPVCVLVVCAEDAVAKWAGNSIELGGGNRFTPLVLGPSGVPEVTDVEEAKADPELAVLSAMSHGGDADTEKALQIAVAAMTASLTLDEGRSLLYVDLVQASLGEAARKALQAMDPAKYDFQSETIRRALAEGKAEGKAEGQAEIVLKLLALRFGPVSEETVSRVKGASSEQLGRFAERVLAAETLEDVFK